MTNVTLPQAQIPIASVRVPGVDKPIPAMIEIEWMRALFDLVQRVGGTVAPNVNVTALLSAINAKPALFPDSDGDSGFAMPGPAGAIGVQGIPGPAMWGEQGEQGEPGLMLFQSVAVSPVSGTATLIAGSVVVSTAAVTANSRIFLTAQSLGTVAVATPVAITARTPGASFTISSSSITDTSVIAWVIFEPN